MASSKISLAELTRASSGLGSANFWPVSATIRFCCAALAPAPTATCARIGNLLYDSIRPLHRQLEQELNLSNGNDLLRSGERGRHHFDFNDRQRAPLFLILPRQHLRPRFGPTYFTRKWRNSKRNKLLSFRPSRCR